MQPAQAAISPPPEKADIVLHSVTAWNIGSGTRLIWSQSCGNIMRRNVAEVLSLSRKRAAVHPVVRVVHGPVQTAGPTTILFTVRPFLFMGTKVSRNVGTLSSWDVLVKEPLKRSPSVKRYLLTICAARAKGIASLSRWYAHALASACPASSLNTGRSSPPFLCSWILGNWTRIRSFSPALRTRWPNSPQAVPSCLCKA